MVSLKKGTGPENTPSGPENIPGKKQKQKLISGKVADVSRKHLNLMSTALFLLENKISNF